MQTTEMRYIGYYDHPKFSTLPVECAFFATYTPEPISYTYKFNKIRLIFSKSLNKDYNLIENPIIEMVSSNYL